MTIRRYEVGVENQAADKRSGQEHRPGVERRQIRPPVSRITRLERWTMRVSIGAPERLP